MDQFLSQTQQQRQMQILAPQLRQSLELLQVPALELRALVQQEMESNPTLEETDKEPEAEGKDPEAPPEEAPAPAAPEPAEDLPPGEQAPGGSDVDEEFRNLARLDDEWREYYRQSARTQSHSAEDAARRQYLMESLTQPDSLQKHLVEQLRTTVFTEHQRQIGELLIGSIDEGGYLVTPVEELASTTAFDPAEIAAVLELVQEFDPVGVGARDLRECLLIQLRRMGKGETVAATIVRDHLGLLGARKYVEIARALHVPVENVLEQSRFIATLEPRPGRRFSSDMPTYVVPEVVVQKVEGEYAIFMESEYIPHLRISDQYRQLMADGTTAEEVKSYIREKVRAGMFLIKSIGHRQQTIQNIAREIVRVQREFLDHGVTHLRPLTMAEVARAVGIHETTVSRAISNKYMQTPRGTFEMKYFFTPGYRMADGQVVSNKTIKDTIERLVEEEDKDKPLSDQEMVDRLTAKGLKVARRTIAKYREELRILPSHLRKGL